MSDIPVTFQAGTLPDGFCPASEQERFNEYVEQLAGSIPVGFTGIIASATVPGPDDQDKLWIKLDGGSGAPLGKYFYYNGHWVWPKEKDGIVDTHIRQFYTGTVNELKTYDGGEDAAVGPFTGPMWEVDEDWKDRIPMGVGDTDAVDTVGGAAEHTIIRAELPAENLKLFANDTLAQPANELLEPGKRVCRRAGGGEPDNNYILTQTDVLPTLGESEALGEGTAFSMLPPVRRIYFVKRTARIYYRGA